MTGSNSANAPVGRARTAALTLAALGVVFGDIGTSPLYTVQTCFSDYTGLKPTPENVLGMLSLITWALIIVVTLKYVVVVMRADNNGEGGVLALMALVSQEPGLSDRRRRLYMMLGIAGAALFYGDCLLTPAISVLSAVEGLNVATTAFKDLVVPISIGLIVGLFAAQRFGTGGVGRLFGPIMLLWFIALFALGIVHVVHHPKVLAALSPLHAIEFALRHKLVAFVSMGAVTLAFTGAEALYADMGHFGRRPIRTAWLGLVFPALLVNYYGQGALLLNDPAALANPFFRLAPGWALYPLVVLATAATVIASQATISGAFSMAQQASLLGLSPRIRIQHTSASEHGQIYVPSVNWLQMIGVVALILGFNTSSSIASAYGIAVTGTMLVTSVLVLGLADVEMGVAGLDPGLRLLSGRRCNAVLVQHAEVLPRRLGAAGDRRGDLHLPVDVAAGPPRRLGAREGENRAARRAAERLRHQPLASRDRHRGLLHGLCRQCLELHETEPHAQRGATRERHPAHHPDCGRALRIARGAPRCR